MTFSVTVDKMVETHQVTWVVTLVNNDLRPDDATVWDSEGIITPFRSKNKSHADHEAAEWATFLGCEVTPARHDYKLTGVGNYDDTYTCRNCGATHSYEAEDCMSEDLLNKLDTSPCIATD